ncbi:hypothetical protein NQ317_006604 [Molorchus minor]|uniref:Uncharacterized protein n=1 Tax=Molorchus minor TaxID=1323400 RepID=A0ABQ9K117_9CUCU|nr:hypothetical protein NQ317_006604 [Molorchus minor]
MQIVQSGNTLKNLPFKLSRHGRLWSYFEANLPHLATGYAFQCYSCHQTTPDCKNGNRDKLEKVECKADKCFSFTYKKVVHGDLNIAASSPGRKLDESSSEEESGYRGCFNISKNEILQKVSPPGINNPIIGDFKECTTTLCNAPGAATSGALFSPYILVVFALYPLYNSLV